MERSKIETLNSMDDITFAIAILNERRNKLNENAPLALKLKAATNTLRQIKENQGSK